MIKKVSLISFSGKIPKLPEQGIKNIGKILTEKKELETGVTRTYKEIKGIKIVQTSNRVNNRFTTEKYYPNGEKLEVIKENYFFGKQTVTKNLYITKTIPNPKFPEFGRSTYILKETQTRLSNGNKIVKSFDTTQQPPKVTKWQLQNSKGKVLQDFLE